MQILSQYQQIHADTCTYLHSHGCPALQFASVARGWLGTPSHRSGCLNTGVLDLLGFRTVTTASTRAAAVGARALHVHVRPRTWKLAASVTVTVTAPGPSDDGSDSWHTSSSTWSCTSGLQSTSTPSGLQSRLYTGEGSLSLSPSLRPHWQCTQADTASPAGPWRRTATQPCFT